MSEQHDRLIKILTEQQPFFRVKHAEHPMPPSMQDPDEFLRQVRAHYAAHPLPAAPPVPERAHATLSDRDGITLTEAQLEAARRLLLHGDRRGSSPHARVAPWRASSRNRQADHPCWILPLSGTFPQLVLAGRP